LTESEIKKELAKNWKVNKNKNNFDENDILLVFGESSDYKFETLKKFKEIYNSFPTIRV
jgi:hypothetical protein